MSIIQLFSSMTAEEAASLIKEDLNSFVRAELERALNDALGGKSRISSSRLPQKGATKSTGTAITKGS